MPTSPYLEFRTTWEPSTVQEPGSGHENPRGVNVVSFGHGGAYDHEDDAVYLPLDKVRIVDVGDADIVHTDTVKSHANEKWPFGPFWRAERCRSP